MLMALALSATAVPAFAQHRPVQVWADVDAVTTRPEQEAQSYSASQTIFSETATGTVNYPTLSNERGTAFSGGVLVFHGLGAGVRFSSAIKRQMTSTITLRLPNPVLFNLFSTDTTQTPLNRKDSAVDVSAVYAIPLGTRFVGARVFAGRSRVEITQAAVQHVTFAVAARASIQGVTTQNVSGFAWGSHFGFDAEFFPLNNLGIGASVLARHVEIPDQIEPFSGKAIALTPDRVVTSFGVRARF
ncbi:MAG TPA: hypothetical protein VF456_23155 [Vicinamibacterales bacterium]